MVIGACLIGIIASSCSTPKNIAYFQGATDNSTITVTKFEEIRVKPEDKLSIVVSTQDPALSQLFNLVATSNQLNVSTSSAKGVNRTTGSGYVAYYTIDPEGDISFPVLGRMHIEGMTRHQIAAYIKNKLTERNLVKDPIVSVEFVNTGISIVGEVRTPGRYEFNRDRLNVVDAIAMAGDLTKEGMRENILVMRELPDGSKQTYRVNLTDMNNLANSPAYWLQQNDVIYVEPSDKAKRDTTPIGNTTMTPAFWMSAVSFLMTMTTMVLALSK